MNDKRILDLFYKMTKNILWNIHDKNSNRVLLRGTYKDINIYVSVVPKLLKTECYCNFLKKDIARQLGESIFIREEK